MRRAVLLLSLLILSLFSTPLWAAGEEGVKKRPEPGTTVEMPYLIVPMSLEGKLLGYAYITSKLICSSPDACIAVREKLAFIQDAFIREVNGKACGLPDDPKTVDKAQLNARLTAAAKRIVGDRKVVSMLFLTVNFAPLHPSESTMGENVPPPERAPDQASAQKTAGEGGKAAAGTSASTTTPKDTAVPAENAQKSRPK